ncbi:HHR071Cp [Eremothecium sinecaudum]|uniref:DNA mismatch repair protein PMS1 n=1 Tax=Eremothecium sinecaudum TaxID=45286 RepID=A0A0X8HWN4_9SACH|nr:HHR071Cp [Eremothecium sinecaudum]AMD22840.1 HHR071Cp [Eremothecium sinecaudum]
MSVSIAAISSEDVHLITSGQVITDLVTAVKELVDNSLDAGATTIDLTFKNYGLEFIECADNGDGISEDNFEYLALKHHTSKIKDFEDVSCITTFGFRGEALSSLCAMASLTVITTQKGPKAYKLEFASNGALKKKTVISRNKGTTVQLKHLFNHLPVRKKEFVKNCRRQFTKCITLLQSYAIISTNCKISVWNHTTSGNKKSLILSTPANSDMSKNIVAVFGSDGLHGTQLISLDLDLNEYKDLMVRKYQDDPDWMNTDYKISITGYISKPSCGCGRLSKDRQFLYVNKRPVEYPQLLKCINMTYRNFNNVQYPVVLLNFELSPEMVDVNVTPDKRTVMLHNEEYVITCLATTLDKHFNSQELELPKSGLINSQPDEGLEPAYKKLKIELEKSIQNTDEEEQETFAPVAPVETASHEYAVEATHDNSSKHDDELKDIESANGNINRSQNMELDHSPVAMQDISEDNDDNKADKEDRSIMQENSHPLKSGEAILDSYIHTQEEPYNSGSKNNSEQTEPLIIRIGDVEILESTKRSKDNNLLFINNAGNAEEDIEVHAESGQESIVTNDGEAISDTYNESSDEILPLKNRRLEIQPKESSPNVISSERKELSSLSKSHTHNLETAATIELQLLKRSLEKIDSLLQSPDHTTSFLKNETFEDVLNAERFLTLSVCKKDFKKMKVVGQFNLGFIIVTRRLQGKHDLFIVDQHASDEKYNFETLKNTTTFKSQLLLKPEPIEMSVIDELIVIDNLEVFNRNGFKFKINETRAQGSRVELISFPTSKRTQFDLNDFHEILRLLKEYDGINRNSIKCSKIRAMFAMRACRMSIMIGKPLSLKTMTSVVRNLGELEKPWNCPHGRPTLRHLMELKDWKSFQDDYQL